MVAALIRSTCSDSPSNSASYSVTESALPIFSMVNWRGPGGRPGGRPGGGGVRDNEHANVGVAKSARMLSLHEQSYQISM